MPTLNLPSIRYIELADGSRKNNLVYGKGNAKVTISDTDGISHDLILKNALCVPSYGQNIFSVRSATKNGGVCVNFQENFAELIAQNGTHFNISNSGDLYYLNNVRNGEISSRTLKDWHLTMGHCNVSDLIKLEKAAMGIKITNKDKFDCTSCIKGKMTQHFNRKPDARANKILELVHCDLTGSITPVGKGGYRYGISFVDDFSGVVHLYLLRNKNDSVIALENFLSDIAPFGTVKRLRSDNGTEFTGEEFESVLRRNSIRHEFSAPHSPHQNGTVERSWRTTFETARCLIFEGGLPKSLWPYAAKYAAYIRNRCFNNRLGMTPYESFTSRKPNLGKMHKFGEKCYAYDQEKKKMDSRCTEGIFIGMDTRSPAYQVYFPENNTVKKVRCVQFLMGDADGNKEGEEYEELLHRGGEQAMPNENPVSEEILNPDNADQSPRYPKRNRNSPKYLEDYVSYSVDYCYRMTDIPKNYKEAMSSQNSEKWTEAMNDELEALKESDTYECTTLPEGKTPIGSRWVYSVKLGANDEEKHKARLVAKGYAQTEGIDYQETFSPTAKFTSIRMLLQLAVQNNYTVHQLDVKAAYLNANIGEEIYLEQPDGYNERNSSGDKLYWKLKKSLYGLKQSGRNWNNMLHAFLTTQDFNQSQSDHCLYTKHDGKSIIIVIVWVDDIIVSSNDNDLIINVKDSFKKRFRMKDLGQISYFLGIDFIFTKDCISINQSKCITKVLKRFDMLDCKAKSIPCDPSVANMSPTDSPKLENPKMYKEIVGSLIYLMTCTRPDLCYTVSKLSQFMHEPTYAHLNVAKHVLKYLKGSIDNCLNFHKCNDVNLYGYCDSDWATSEDRKSISGYCYKLGEHSPLISWKSKKQSNVALSSCEAEYVALAVAVQELKFLNQLLLDMNIETAKPVKLYVDNQGAIALAKNPVQHQRCKHIDIKYHYVRDEIENGYVNLIYVPSEQNLADIFTKPVTKVKLSNFINDLGM